MRRRIAGVETEYGIACMVNGKQRLNADEIAHHFFTPVVHTYHSSTHFHEEWLAALPRCWVSPGIRHLRMRLR